MYFARKLILYVLVFSIGFIELTFTDGFVGCLYKDNLCISTIEWCFNDNAYGKCISIMKEKNNENLYRYEGNLNYFKQLNNDLDSLFEMGFKWQDNFVQCHIQQFLNSIRYKEPFDDKLCLEFLSDTLHEYLENDQDLNQLKNVVLSFPDNKELDYESSSVDKSAIFLPSSFHSYDTNIGNEQIRSDKLYTEPSSELKTEFLGSKKAVDYFVNMSNIIEELRKLPLTNVQLNDLISNNNYQQLNKFLKYYQNEHDKEMEEFDRKYYKKPHQNVENLDKKSNQSKVVYTESGPIFLDISNPELEKSADDKNNDTKGMKKNTRAFAAAPQNLLNANNDGFIVFNESLLSWNQGNDILKSISKYLHLDPNSFTHINVHDKELEFQMTPSLLKMNASDFIRKIESVKNDVKNMLGLEINSVGFGPKNRSMVSFSHYVDDEPHKEMLIVFVILGVCSSILISICILFVIKKKMNGQNPFDTIEHRICGKSGHTIIKGGETSTVTANINIWSDEPVVIDIDTSVGHMILSYMENYLKNNEKLEEEWESLQNFFVEKNSTKIALLPENMKKNRDKKIVPYDHTRIILNKLYSPTGNDYINASGIFDHDFRNPDYIAAQGPLADTLLDFWQMVWEKHVIVIVMLTKLTENNKSMCCRYWPEDGSQIFHVYEIHLVSEHIWCDDYLVRSFYLKNRQTGETRTVTQFHFISWPENGSPALTKTFLEYRRKINKIQHVRKHPILVHCNDGSGRTGTFILIDLVLNRILKGAKEIDIAATLEHLREQRNALVANKDQFQFALMAVTEEIHNILKTLPPDSSPKDAEIFEAPTSDPKSN